MTSTLRGVVKGNHAISFPVAPGQEISFRLQSVIEWDIVGSQSPKAEGLDDPDAHVRGVLRESFPDWKAVEAFIDAEREAWQKSEE